MIYMHAPLLEGVAIEEHVQSLAGGTHALFVSLLVPFLAASIPRRGTTLLQLVQQPLVDAHGIASVDDGQNQISNAAGFGRPQLKPLINAEKRE